MNTFEHLIFLIQERQKRMSVEFEALKEATAKLLAAHKEALAELATLKNTPAPAPDPAPADVAALTTEIDAALNPPA